MRTLVVLVALSLACGLGFGAGGCATIVNGKTQDIAIATNPPGATCYIDSGQTVVTPSSVNLRRNKDYVLTITKDGYQPQTVPLTSVMSGWMAGNILLGGIIGGGIDAATGAAWTITPEKVNINLIPLSPGQAAVAPSNAPLSDADKLRIAEQMHRDGALNDKAYAAVQKKYGVQPAQAEEPKKASGPIEGPG